MPERCRPKKSASRSDESDSESKEEAKSKRRSRIARSAETEVDEDELACEWVHRQKGSDLSQVIAECTTQLVFFRFPLLKRITERPLFFSSAPQLQSQVGESDRRVDNGPGREGGERGRPERPLLNCFFREVVTRIFRRICPMTCGVCTGGR